MGCGSSKVDDQPAVALCRHRLKFLDEAIQRRYHLAESHRAYLHSLNSVAMALPRFFNLPHPHHLPLHLPPSSSPTTNLNPRPTAAVGSHLPFGSESDEGDDVSSGSFHHSSPSPSPPHSLLDYAAAPLDPSFYGGGGGGGGGFMNYMQSRATPSVSYQHLPVSSQTGHADTAQPPSFLYSNTDTNFGYPTHGIGGASFPPAAPSSSKPPPPPPSPPRSSPWDFLTFFETTSTPAYPSHSHTPSRNSKEVRDEEGIPDLEDLKVEYYQQHHPRQSREEEVVEQVQANTKVFDAPSVVPGAGYGNGEAGGRRPSTSMSVVSVSSSEADDGLEFEVHVVGNQKSPPQDHRPRRHPSNNLGAHRGPPGLPEIFRVIQLQFQRASDSVNQLSTMLEVGKVPHRKHAPPPQVSSKVSHVISSSSSSSSSSVVISSQPSSSGSAEYSTSVLPGLEGDADLEMRSINLSSTLQKCYLWEEKLYEEVKAEEKIRIVHERKCQKLKRLDERGAEANKLNSTRTLIRSLSTKIRFAIQVVDKISVKINKLRDEELWPQINELIQGLTRMWKSMLECHRSQCEAIKEARNLDAIALTFSDDHLEATLEFERELINWILRFSSWIGAQKGYVRALNNWLMKCLLYEPEETPDGRAPFSPGTMGAPPLFVVCNQWCEALERLSEKEVVDSIRVFAVNVLKLWERDKLKMRERMAANKDLERTKNMEDDYKMQKGIQALNKMALTSGDCSGFSLTEQIVNWADTSDNSSLQANLQHIFEAMERLAASSTRAYEELLQRNEEDMIGREGQVVIQ